MCGGERSAWHDLGPVEMRERRGRRGFEAELDDIGQKRRRGRPLLVIPLTGTG